MIRRLDLTLVVLLGHEMLVRELLLMSSLLQMRRGHHVGAFHVFSLGDKFESLKNLSGLMGRCESSSLVHLKLEQILNPNDNRFPIYLKSGPLCAQAR